MGRIVAVIFCSSLLLGAAARGQTRAERIKNAVPPKHSLPSLPQQVQNPNAYLYGYIMDVGVGTKYDGLTVVAIHPAGMHETYWETLPICGKRGADLNPVIGHWTLLVYSRDAKTGSTFCRDLHLVKVVE
jgi:hypothetical protein